MTMSYFEVFFLIEKVNKLNHKIKKHRISNLTEIVLK